MKSADLLSSILKDFTDIGKLYRKWSKDFSEAAHPDYGQNTPQYLFFVGLLSRHAAFAKMNVDEIYDDFVNFVLKYFEHPFVIQPEVKKRKEAGNTGDWEVEDEVKAVIDEIENTANNLLTDKEMEIVNRLYFATEKIVLLRYYMRRSLKQPVSYKPSGETARVTKNSVTSELTISNNASTEEELEEILDVISPFKNVNSLDVIDKDDVEFYIIMTVNKLKRMRHNFFPKVIQMEDDQPLKASESEIETQVVDSEQDGDFTTVEEQRMQNTNESINIANGKMDEAGDRMKETTKISEWKESTSQQEARQGEEFQTGKTCSLF